MHGPVPEPAPSPDLNRRSRRIARALGTVVLIACASCGSNPAPPASASAPPPSPPVVLIGIDAADWLAIDPLVQRALLPSFARFKKSGRTGVMLSTPPLVSPIVWTTIATGMPPEKHGVLDFVVD